MSKLKIIFLGTPPFVQPIKERLAKYFTMVDDLKKADLAVVAAYGHILSKQELDAPKYGCINVHPSLLPKYRGPSPIQSTILNGDRVSGVTIMKMDEKIDHGPVIYTEQILLSKQDTFDSLSKKMFLRSSKILPKIIKDFIAGKIKSAPQYHSQSTYTSYQTRKNGYFDINNPPSPEILDRMVRAYYPWPGVWTRWNDKIVKFLPERKIQMEGKKVMDLKDFLNGYPDFPIKSTAPESR